MRLFIGVPLPPIAVGEVTDVLRHLKAREWPVRWVGNEGIHVTIKFFGEVTTDRVDSIAEMLDFATEGMEPIAMTPGSAGVFPGREHPRVIRLDMDAGPDLELMQDRIERAAEQLGFAPEGRPFHPHITLGRVREGHRLPGGWEHVLGQVRPGTPFLADRVVLYESELKPGGPAYVARGEVVLR
ncbi:MAG: RNA 2',3'-cyclic phosphodiesterase [Gemmatimonadota bacterium]